MVSLDSSNSTTITTFTTTHCCSSGGSRSAAAGESRCGRGGGATEEGNGWAGGDNGSEAAHKTLIIKIQQSLSPEFDTFLKQHGIFKCFTDVLKEEPDNSYAQMSLYDYYNATHQEQLAGQMLDKILMS